MNNFFIIAIVLLVLAVLFVFVPLRIKAKKQQLEISNANVIKQRIEELEVEVAQGLITEKDKTTSIKELKLALVDETENESNESSVTTSSQLTILLSIPAIAVGIWVYIQTNHLDELKEYKQVLSEVEALSQKVLSDNGQEVTANDYAKYALIIRERLREAPDDAQGWMYLGQTQLAIGRIDDSIAAFERGLRLTPNDIDMRVRFVNALIASGSETSLNKAQRQMDLLIAQQPNNRQHRLLQTVVAAQRKDAMRAGQNFAMIKDQLTVDSDFYRSLVTQLRNIGVDEVLLDTDVMVAALETTAVNTEISISNELLEKVPDEGFLILFAQDALSGSQVPLAVKRIEIPEFPARLKLTTDDAMLPNMTIDTAEQINITARISKDADVAVSSGELQGVLENVSAIKNEAISVKLIINQEL